MSKRSAVHVELTSKINHKILNIIFILMRTTCSMLLIRALTSKCEQKKMLVRKNKTQTHLHTFHNNPIS